MSEHYACNGGGDVAAYALGALDDTELHDFERHLDTCSICQAEVESFARLTAVLPMAAPQHPASRALTRRVMADVKADARRQRAAREFSGATRRVSPRQRAGLLGSTVAMLLILAVVVVSLSASGTSRKGTHIVSASVGSAQVVISAQHGELIVHRLNQLSRAQTYEVWERRANGAPQPTSALFNTSATGDSAVNLPGSLQGVREILVTRERSGGAAVPHSKPVVVARLS